MLSILDCLGGAELCACASTCQGMAVVAHDEALWLPESHLLQPDWTATANPRFAGEKLWAYTLRIRHNQLSDSMWKKLDAHRNGYCPYLAEIGTVVSGKFLVDKSRLCTTNAPSLKYGAICELVHLEAARGEGGVSHRTYKAVAEEIAGLSADAKTAMPNDMHMVIRELYKTCYVGFGMASGAASAGMGFGDPGSLAQVIARKGVVRRASREAMGGSSPRGRHSNPVSPSVAKHRGRRVSRESIGSGRGAADEEMRRNLEMQHGLVSLLGT